MLSLDTMLAKIRVGNDAGWALLFYKDPGKSGDVAGKPDLPIGRHDYYAEIDATLPAGLEAGTYTFTVEGMTDDDYGKLRSLTKSPKEPCLVRLYLYWVDTNASPLGYVKSLASLIDAGSGPTPGDLEPFLVSELSVTSVSRKAGARRYEAVIKASERVFRKLSKRLDAPLAITKFDSGVQSVAGLAGITINRSLTALQPAATGTKAGDEKASYKPGTTLAAVLTDLGKKMQQSANKYGRGIFLIRDGKLEFGARGIPLKGESKGLTPNNGLLLTEKLAPLSVDPKVKDEETEETSNASREQYQLTLKGRPDIKPGDVVTFDPLPEDSPLTGLGALAAVAGSFAGPLLQSLGGGGSNQVKAYVNSVQHKLGRKTGFSTVITVVELKTGDEQWSAPAGSGPAAGGETDAKGASAHPGVEAAKAVRKIAETVLAEHQAAEVGEVRGMNLSGTSEPPAQTLKVWQGLVPPDGRANQGRRLDIQRTDPTVLEGVAYVTPFAWGKSGLIVPRYPGTRVLLVHRNGELHDPIDVGAVWESGTGPDSQAGDWWLILPADVKSADRATIADSDIATFQSQKATNDLIDADGNRVIEVGNLTVRVGPSHLNAPGTRPAAPSNSNALVTIEVGQQTSIAVDSNGTITLTAKQDIVLDATNGHIKLKAQTVDVSG